MSIVEATSKFTEQALVSNIVTLKTAIQNNKCRRKYGLEGNI